MKHATTLTAAALAAFLGFAAGESPKPPVSIGDLAVDVKPKTETAKPKTETAKPKTETAKPKTDTAKPKAAVVDVIDFKDAVDDSAKAARGKAEIKLKPSSKAAVAEKADNRDPGLVIASKFLAEDDQALVDITSDEATLTDVLRQFRKTTGANIIYAESTNLQQRVSVSLRQVPWLQAMSSILNSRGFRVESVGDIHFVKEDKAVDPTFTRSFLLNHASVEDLANLFNASYGVKTPDGKVVKGVATPFPGANTIVVTASDRVLSDCEKIIKSVDRAVPQIYIEARFIELSNQAMHKLGVQWDQLQSWGASVHDLNAGIEYNNGRKNSFTKNSSSVNSSSSTSGDTVSTSQSTSFTREGLEMGTSRLTDKTSHEADMAWRNARVFSGQLSPDDFSIAMSAFERLEDARIFSNPKIVVSNGREALVDMTTKYPNITLTSQHDTQSGYTKSDAKLDVIPGEDKLFAKSAFFSWGITLTVKPRISPDGLISVEIVPSISELDTDVTPDGFYQISGGTDAPYGRYPIIKYKRLTTDFTMKDGSTAVIGGLSKTEEGDIDSGIPYLRDIPWIGNKLFGWKSRGKVQKEIIVFVTVGIADPSDLPEDIGLPKNAVRGREYVEHRAAEPGDRKNAAVEALKLDMRPMEEQRQGYAEKFKSAEKVPTPPTKK